MKKLKLYLDTSVISHLRQEDAQDKMQDTLALWEDIKDGKYDVYLSYRTLEEIEKCYQPKKEIMFNLLSEIESLFFLEILRLIMWYNKLLTSKY